MKKRPWSLAVVEGGEDTFESVLVLVEVKALSQAELARAIGAWTEALATASGSILEDGLLRDRDPWFGFGLSYKGAVLDEEKTLQRLSGRRVPPAVAAFVEAVITFNAKHEVGLATHEELETGTHATEWLVLQDLAFLPLYLRFLESIDLEHTVAQVEVVRRLAERYSPAQLRPLTDWCRKHHWSAGGRVLKQDAASTASSPNPAAKPLYEEGMRLMQSGRLAQARQLADRAVALAPSDPEVLFLDLRLAWREANSPAAALQKAEERLCRLDASRDPKAVGRLFNLLGCALDALGKWPEALGRFQEAVAAQPQEQTFIANVAEVQEKLGNLPAAREAAKRARRLGAKNEVIARLLDRKSK